MDEQIWTMPYGNAMLCFESDFRRVEQERDDLKATIASLEAVKAAGDAMMKMLTDVSDLECVSPFEADRLVTAYRKATALLDGAGA